MAAVHDKEATMFENPEIDMQALPQAAAISWRSMDAKFLRRLLTQSMITLVILTIGIGVMTTIFRIAFAGEAIPFNTAYLWLLVPLIAIPLIFGPLLKVPRIGFAVRDRDILYKSGVFWHTVTVVPFNRIQHVEKSSTPLDRRFGVATLQLFTAGGSGGDLNIHGLSADDAENLRVFIIEKVGSIVERH